ncbi:MAG: DUF3302 domain-containing protein [Xanthobacteraceae bacterium]
MEEGVRVRTLRAPHDVLHRPFRLDRLNRSRGDGRRGLRRARDNAGHIARKRGHPWAEAVTVGSWATLICSFVF